MGKLTFSKALVHDRPMAKPALDLSKLTAEEKLEMLDDLWASLSPAEIRAARAANEAHGLDDGEPEDGVEEAWSEEIRRRLAEVDASEVTAIPWSEARRRLFAAARGRGEGR